MDSVKSALAWAMQELSQSRVESPRLTAELLLAHVLSWDRVRVFSHPEGQISFEAADSYAILIRRRAKGEPLQYITGVQEFYGLRFRVTPAVLIPRPETEIVVENAVTLARTIGTGPLRFADVGTGSGCIAISFAREVPDATGWGTDISIDALAVARENAACNGVLGRIGFLCTDLLEGFTPNPRFDLVISNPPYVAGNDAAVLPAVVREYEPAIALFSGPSGLDSYRRLIPQAARSLVPGGWLILELGAGMAGQVSRLMEPAGFSVENIASDLQGIPRCMLARRRHG
jgi:release factor glutamine methyltransferase